uniref:Uncharacterized protein n=1 Tax=Setaria digitata TaxID=48799 RepID=A0A915PHR3_9BILA
MTFREVICTARLGLCLHCVQGQEELQSVSDYSYHITVKLKLTRKPSSFTEPLINDDVAIDESSGQMRGVLCIQVCE